jgi:hypothetical protein
MPKRVLAFGEVASTIRNNLIADLLLLSKCHAPAQSLLGLGLRRWIFAPALCLLKPPQPQVQARKRGRVPYSYRLWSLAALHGIKGRRRYSGGEWAHLWWGLEKNRKEEAGLKHFWGKYYNFFGIPDYTEVFFVCSNHAQENTI